MVWAMIVRPECVDANGYLVSGGQIKRVPDAKIDGKRIIRLAGSAPEPDNFKDHLHRPRWRVVNNTLVESDQPIDAECRQREVDLRCRFVFDDDDRQRAMEDFASGDPSALQRMRQIRQQIEQEVDAEIAAGTPLRDKSDIVAEARQRRHRIVRGQRS
jgi:hypothetical protein